MTAGDFDFLHGSWRISHRTLKERLSGCQEWEAFESTMRCWPILGRAANMDETYFSSRGNHGMTIRLYDKDADTWSLFWIDSRFARIEPPVTGRFADGAGTFLGPDAHNGIPVVCRYLWSDITADSVRWAQALSADDGATWETNWVMEMTRTEETP
jgi:hypothetical protein